MLAKFKASPVAFRSALRRHPTSPSDAVCAIAASASFTDGGTLAIGYRLQGDLEGIRIPEPAVPAASNELWQNTCLEAFIAPIGSGEYHEFNFSPSGQWASYRFSAYRRRDVSFVAPAVPRMTFRLLADGFRLDVLLPSAMLPLGAKLNIGLSAVIETHDGDKSYWALAHCAAQPDFHLRQSFTLTLQRPTS